jgi:hypothetical protein
MIPIESATIFIDHLFVLVNQVTCSDPKYKKDFFPHENYPESTKLVNKLV